VGYLGRQPILDRRGAVFGYELHFHGKPGEPTVPEHAEQADEAAPSERRRQRGGLSQSSRGILDSLALYGVERFTGGAWGFVPCGLDVLDRELLEGLPPPLTVLEIPACAEPPAQLIRECSRLRHMGFRLALSGYQPGDARQALLPLAQYVKVGIGAIDSPQWSALSNQLYAANAFLIAENIHSHEAYGKARAGGLQYFQGYYFCNPELFPNGTVPADRAHHLQVLHELFKDPLDLKILCPLVSRDPSLVYRLLRFVNSPMCAVRNPVTSIETAMLILGDATFRRIAALAIQCALSEEQSPELLRMAQIRARFCGQAAALCGLDDEEMYLVGMLSLLPAMLQVPMQTILPHLPLRSEICRALGGSTVRERCLLAWIEALEANDIPKCEEIAGKYALDKNQLGELYMDALEQVANDIVRA
jgi:EAL and modified HD-GYP domain-containing signal transduction protein